ncbi:hypothetical protein Tco_0963419, partial [Tanacetum coccineum]
MPVVTCA